MIPVHKHIVSVICFWFLCVPLGCGGGGGGDATSTNVPPIAKASASGVVAQGSEVILDGASSNDPDGRIVSYQWVQTNGTSATLSAENTASARFLAPENGDREDLEFQLTVKDDGGAQSSDTVVVTVNVKPETSAGQDQFAYDSSVITLTGTATDSDGTIVTHQWVQTGGTAVELDGETTSTVSFKTPSITGALTFSYTATDNDGAQQSDAVSVYVSKVLFSDFFDSASSMSDWTTVDDTGNGTDWSVASGELVQQNNVVSRDGAFLESYHLGTFAYLDTSAFDSRNAFRFSVDVIPRANSDGSVEGNDVGIMFPFSDADADNYLRLSMNSRYGFTRLERREGARFTTLAVNAIGYANNKSMTVTVEINGGTIIVFVDDEPLFAETNLTLGSGTIALYSQDKVSFDNVVIAENSPQPMVAIVSPLAYTIALTPNDGDTLEARAVVLNKPEDSQVMFALDNGSESKATASANSYSVQFSSVTDGEHEIAATLRDVDDAEMNRDTNTVVGVGGDYIITVGDSITNGSGDEDAFNNNSSDGRIISWQGFQAKLADDLTTSTGLPQIVFNEGIGGDRSFELEADRIESILERHPGANKMLLLIGANDATNGTLTGVFETNVSTVANQAATDVDKVYIARNLPIYDDTGNLQTAYDSRIQDFNTELSLITDAASSDDLLPGPNFYDLFWGKYDSLYDPDGLHPNDAGYQEIAEAWHTVLMSTR